MKNSETYIPTDETRTGFDPAWDGDNECAVTLRKWVGDRGSVQWRVAEPYLGKTAQIKDLQRQVMNLKDMSVGGLVKSFQHPLKEES